MSKKFELNQGVEDVVTGFKGIIMAVTEYNTGCVQYGISPRKMTDDGKVPEWIWLDGSRLISTEDAINIQPAIGGPHPNAPSI